MRFFWWKLGAFLAAIVAAMVCLIFLFCNHHDSLAKFIPASAEAYLNAGTSDLLDLPVNQQKVYLTWLAAQSTIPAEKWESILRGLNSEIGLFSMNGQIFGAVKNTARAHSLIARQEIPYAVEEKIIYFPTLKVSAAKLNEVGWFKSVRQRLTFAPYILYLKDQTAAKISLPFTNGNRQPLTFLGKIHQNGLRLVVLGAVGQTVEDKIRPQINNLPADTKLYFRNLLAAESGQKTEFTAENLRFNLLKSLTGPVEYLETAGGFSIFAGEKQNPVEQVQNNITQLLAYTAPTEVDKILPDGTFATQFIANPNQWQFVKTDTGSSLSVTKLNATVKITESDDLINVTTVQNDNESTTAEPINKIFSSCRKFAGKSGLIFNLPAKSDSVNISRVTVINKSASKLYVCID